MRDGGLQGIETVIQRQQGVPPESDDHGLLLDRQDRRSRLLRSGPEVRDGAARLPLADGLLVYAVTLGEGSQALLTMLYRSTDRLVSPGAPKGKANGNYRHG